jgi:tRNA A-37 threonylcarbamoyl transferase component Bud32
MVEQAITQLGIDRAKFDADNQSNLQDLLNGIEEHSSEFEKETQEQINQLLQDRIEYLNQIDNIGEKQNQLVLEQKARIQDINEGVKKSNDRGRTQGTVKAIAAGLQATTAMVGMMKVLSSETATAEDRASALFNGILGGAASAISAINPMAGMIAQMGIGLLDTLGISKLFAAALETESEKAARIAKEANEAYEEQAQRVKDVENGIDNLQSSFNKYEDSLETLNNLTKGTEEWEEAVYNVNQQVLDLMEKFPLLAQHVKEVNGVLTIDKEGYQEVLKQQKLMLAQDRQAAAAAKAGANRTSQESLITNYGDTLKKFSADAYKYINSKNLGDAVLSIYRNNADLFTKDTKDIVQALKETLGSTFSDSELNAIANEIKNNSNNLKNLDTSVKSLDESTKILNQQFASGYIDAFGNKILSNSAYKSVLSDAIADIYDSEEYKKWFDENYNENMHNAKVDSTVGQEYVANVRKNWTYKGQDDEGYIKFADENGQEVKLADETVREAVARKIFADTYFNEETLSKRNQELLRLQEELKATLEIDQNTAQELINSMASGKSIDFSLLTNEQIKSFQQWIGTSGGK